MLNKIAFYDLYFFFYNNASLESILEIKLYYILAKEYLFSSHLDKYTRLSDRIRSLLHIYLCEAIFVLGSFLSSNVTDSHRIESRVKRGATWPDARTRVKTIEFIIPTTDPLHLAALPPFSSHFTERKNTGERVSLSPNPRGRRIAIAVPILRNRILLV